MGTTLSTERIVREYGSYYAEKEAGNRQRLFRSIVQPAVSLEKHAKKRISNDTEYKTATYEFESLIQPFKKTFDPKGKITFYPNPIKLRQIKSDSEVYPNEIEDSWLGFLADNGCDPKKFPLIKFLSEEYIAKQIQADRELKMVYKGKYNPDGTKPEDCMDGIKELLKKGATDEYPINIRSGIGELDASRIFDQIELFDKSLPPIYNEYKVVIYMAPEWVRLYKEDKRAQGFYFIDNEKQLDESVMFTKHSICPLPSMQGTNDIWATVEGNLLWLTKREGNFQNMQMQAHDRCVHYLLDWWEGIGFACNQLVWTTKETLESTLPETVVNTNIGTINSMPVTLPATDIASTTAKLKGKNVGEALPDGAVVGFAYGTTEALGSEVVATFAEGVYTGDVASLTAATEYYYQMLIAIPATAGTEYITYNGKIEKFTTLSA